MPKSPGKIAGQNRRAKLPGQIAGRDARARSPGKPTGPTEEGGRLAADRLRKSRGGGYPARTRESAVAVAVAAGDQTVDPVARDREPRTRVVVKVERMPGPRDHIGLQPGRRGVIGLLEGVH